MSVGRGTTKHHPANRHVSASMVHSPIVSVGPYTTTNSKGVTNINFSRPISNAYKSTTTPIPLLISQNKYHKHNNFSVLSQTNDSTATHTVTNKVPRELDVSYNAQNNLIDDRSALNAYLNMDNDAEE